MTLKKRWVGPALALSFLCFFAAAPSLENAPQTEVSFPDKIIGIVKSAIDGLGFGECGGENSPIIANFDDRMRQCKFREGEAIVTGAYLGCLTGPLEEFKKIKGPGCKKNQLSHLRESAKNIVLHRIKKIDLARSQAKPGEATEAENLEF